MNLLFAVATSLLLTFFTAATGRAADLSGVWTKTTSGDVNNVAVFYQEGNRVEAVGVGRVGGKTAVWRAAGRIHGNRVRLSYHYSADATPPGWEPDGTMEMALSEDATRLRGTAASRSGGWSGAIGFKRIRILQPVEP